MKRSGTFEETYFTPIRPQFWKWTGKENSEIECTWLGTPLLIFRDELTIVLKELQPGGWPDLTPILLLCLATSTHWENSRKWLQRKLAVSTSVSAQYTQELLSALDRIQELPPELKSSPQAKSALIRIAFEDTSPYVSPESAPACLNFLQSLLPHLDGESLEPAAYQESDGEAFIEQTRSLKRGLARIDPESLRNLVQTSLQQQLLPAPVKIPEVPLTFRERLASWLTDRELFGLARIATRLISLLKWTQPLKQPQDSSQGGISDISNRGPLDRLLLSELAQDDDTLAIRIALNEALFLKREASSTSPPYRREILVDTSLRMWGLPRIYAASTALALAAAQDVDQTLSVSVSLLERNEIREVDLSNRDGCLELLAGLSPVLNPADLISQWIRETGLKGAHIEPVLVTCKRTFDLPEVQNGLSQISGQYFVAIVEGDGRFELRQHSKHGWKTFGELTLDLEQLLKPLQNTTPLKITPRFDDYVPAILRANPFPLRLPFQLLDGKFWTVSNHQVLSFASGGRLLYWDQRDKGPLQIGIREPIGEVESWCTVPDYLPPLSGKPITPQLSHAVIAGHTWTLITVDLEAKTMKVTPLVTNSPTRGPWRPRILVVPECVFLISQVAIVAFSLETGEKLAQLPTNPFGTLSFFGNRYLCDQERSWYRLSYDGSIHLAPVSNSRGATFIVAGTGPSEPLLLPMMYDRQTSDMRRVPNLGKMNGLSFWQHDSYVLTGQDHVFERRRQVSSTPDQSGTIGIWDLASTPWELNRSLFMSKGHLLRSLALPHIHLRNTLRTKFTAISVGADGVALRSNHQKWWRIMIAGNVLKLAMREPPEAASQIINFRQFDAGSQTRAFLGGTLPIGNSLRLDPRGLLHLIPADSKTPEITLVLDENQVSGWIDDGRLFGDSYYTGGSGISTPHAWHKIVEPFFGIES